ncbi:MAG: hypothetical protein JJT96_20790 [Opitutales bacterium]|nr:hypothetical protein [Opitutales bacterium]
MARKFVYRPGEAGVFHCINRCVRRAFLCGWDGYSGRSFEHRREWVRERVKELCGIFALEVCAYAVMANYVHLVVRTRPEVASAWSDEEVARRWLRLCPGRRDQKLQDTHNIYLTEVPISGLMAFKLGMFPMNTQEEK